MNGKINIEKVVTHWVDSSDMDFKTMNNLYKSKDYSWALFVGHLVIEKLLKACYVKVKHQHPLFIHNLVRIAEDTGIVLLNEVKNKLAAITLFNMKARYEDDKKDFYKKCTKDFTKEWIDEIKSLTIWIKEQHLK